MADSMQNAIGMCTKTISDEICTRGPKICHESHGEFADTLIKTLVTMLHVHLSHLDSITAMPCLRSSHLKTLPDSKGSRTAQPASSLLLVGELMPVHFSKLSIGCQFLVGLLSKFSCMCLRFWTAKLLDIWLNSSVITSLLGVSDLPVIPPALCFIHLPQLLVTRDSKLSLLNPGTCYPLKSELSPLL